MEPISQLLDVLKRIRGRGLPLTRVILVSVISLIYAESALTADSHDIDPGDFRFYKTNANNEKRRLVFGRTLVINCTTNDPFATTDLFLKPYLLTESENTAGYEDITRQGDVFMVNNFGVDTAGLYECRSTNKFGITIKWNDPKGEVLPVIEHVPKATISTNNTNLDIGDNFNLSCTSSYDNTIKWYKVTNRSKYTIPRFRTTESYEGTKNTKNLTLMLVDVRIRDSGYYICQASWQDKNDTKTARIQVLEQTRPRIVRKSKALVMRSPLKLSIFCNFKGYPLPIIKWYKNMQRLKFCVKKFNSQNCKNERIVIEERKRRWNLVEGRLTIRKSLYRDRGIYVCQALNGQGDVSTDISVTIETRARILIKSEEQNIRTNLGKSLNITCKAQGNPLPIVTWSKPNSFKVMERGLGKAVLTIKEISSKDIGNYTCNASNFHSDLKVFSVQELKSLTPQTPEQQKASLNSDHLIIIVVSICIIMIILIAIAVLQYRRHKALSEKYHFGLDIADYQIDPDRSLFEQCKNLPYDYDFEFPEERLFLGEPLGSGAFGQVLQAEAFGIQSLRPRDKSPEAVQMRAKLRRDSKQIVKKKIKKGRCESITYTNMTVAVKTLKGGATKGDYTDLASELKILIHLGEHQNIINVLGACTRGRGLMVIIEYAPYGNLLTFLKERRDIYEPKWVKATDTPDQELTLVDLMMMAYGISQGMVYLASKKCVHRDLAARNILVGQDYVIKISDFGLARDIYQEDLYVKTSRGLLPIKWMALESLFDRVYTHMTDVWSFGIALWEIFTLGGTPYPTIPIEQLMEYLSQGQRMPQPSDCPSEVYQLMSQCWEYRPPDRPTFVEISYKLEQIFQENASEDMQGYLQLNKHETPSKVESIMPEQNSCNIPSSIPSPSADQSQASTPSTNNNQYNQATNTNKVIEHRPLLHHVSSV